MTNKNMAHTWHDYAAFDLMHARKSYELALASSGATRAMHERRMLASIELAAGSALRASAYEAQCGSVFPGVRS
jgi:hypothetical protein